MTDSAVFKATYAGYAWVKTRGVAQFIFEVPQHEVNLALTVMGGMPNSAAETWCAIARLEHQPESESLSREIATPTATTTVHNEAPASKPAQGIRNRTKIAGRLSNDRLFQVFLNKKYGTAVTADAAAQKVRDLCGVKSRKDILSDTVAAEYWDILESAFIGWRDEPALTND